MNTNMSYYINIERIILYGVQYGAAPTAYVFVIKVIKNKVIPLA